MSSEKRAAVAALLVSVFVAGALGGAVASRVFDRGPRDEWQLRPSHSPRPPGMSPQGGSRGAEGWPRGFAPMILSDRVAGALDLTEEQREQVREILEGRQSRSAEILREIEPRLRAQLDSIQGEIRAILEPSQQERFDEFMQREEEMFMRRMARPDSGSPPRR